jgi:hypothetical protein
MFKIQFMPHLKHCSFVTSVGMLMLYKEINYAFSDNHTGHINTSITHEQYQKL